MTFTASPELLARIEAAKKAVLAQTELLSQHFGRAESHWKKDGTRVTAIDIKISENIFRELSAQFPVDQYFSEELAEDNGPIAVTARFAWVLDPIDGTNNFALGIPHCAISLGLLEAGQPAYGVVYDYSRKKLVTGGPGFGTKDGDNEVHVSNKEPHIETLVGFHSPSNKAMVPYAEGILSNFKIRGLGSATLHLTYVACGIIDGCVDYNVKIWDLAAAIALCRGAGGEVTFINGEQLPMKQFDLNMGRIFYVAGGPKMRARFEALSGKV